MHTSKFTIAAAVSAAIFIGMPVSAHAGLVVNELGTGALTAQNLAINLLAGTSGITISNAQFIGRDVQGGTFTGGVSSGLTFNSGIVLSSGKVRDLPMPIVGTFGADTNLAGAGDSMLTGIIGAATRDAAVLKFNFVPIGNTVQMTYVFGSSEYNQWVGSHYNDVMGVFVNGVNAALVPGTLSPISVNNVNCGPDGDAASGLGANCGSFINNRTADDRPGQNVDINLGGLTHTFSFSAAVNPKVINTMVIGVADTGDWKNDATVFISGGSLNSAVPEPSTALCMSGAFAALLLVYRRKLAAMSAV